MDGFGCCLLGTELDNVEYSIDVLFMKWINHLQVKYHRFYCHFVLWTERTLSKLRTKVLKVTPPTVPPLDPTYEQHGSRNGSTLLIRGRRIDNLVFRKCCLTWTAQWLEIRLVSYLATSNLPGCFFALNLQSVEPQIAAPNFQSVEPQIAASQSTNSQPTTQSANIIRYKIPPSNSQILSSHSRFPPSSTTYHNHSSPPKMAPQPYVSLIRQEALFSTIRWYLSLTDAEVATRIQDSTSNVKHFKEMSYVLVRQVRKANDKVAELEQELPKQSQMAKERIEKLEDDIDDLRRYNEE